MKEKKLEKFIIESREICERHGIKINDIRQSYYEAKPVVSFLVKSERIESVTFRQFKNVKYSVVVKGEYISLFTETFGEASPPVGNKTISNTWMTYDQSLFVQIALFKDVHGSDKDTESDITEIISSNDDPTDKQRLITARLGQGDYRKGLLNIWGKCSVTSCATKELLIASHIKPWRVSDNQERLDPFNGLLLIATVDKAFDSGLISFSDDGSILISPLFNEHELAGISLDMKIELREQNLPYLAHHRENVFRR